MYKLFKSELKFDDVWSAADFGGKVYWSSVLIEIVWWDDKRGSWCRRGRVLAGVGGCRRVVRAGVVGRRKAGGRVARGSSTLHHSLHLHRRVWRADGRVSFSPRRLSGVRGRMRGREVQRWLVAARVRGTPHGRSAAPAAGPHAPACPASPSMRLPLLPLLVLPLVLARPAAGELYPLYSYKYTTHHQWSLSKFFSGLCHSWTLQPLKHCPLQPWKSC